MKDKKLSLWAKIWFWFNSGGIAIQDDNYKEVAVIKYDKIYIHVLEGDTGWSVSYDTQPPAHYPIRDILVTSGQAE
jgi:hypothetical protein